MIERGRRALILLTGIFMIPMVLGAAVPQEIVEAETKYAEAVTKVLESSKGDQDAREKLAKLNTSFVAHLKNLRPKVMARNEGYTKVLSDRIKVMERKLDASVDLVSLDGRATALFKPEPSKTKPSKQKLKLGSQPSGKIESRSSGKRVEIGDVVEIKGSTKNIPDGHVVRIFGMPNWRGIFPMEDNKDPNRRFKFDSTVTETWLGSVSFILISCPDDLMEELETWMVVRRRWADAGFPKDSIPTFQRVPTKNLYLDQITKLGALNLGQIKVDYVR